MLLTNTTYDLLKRFVQVILPALASLYFGLASIWGLPAAEQVVGTIAVLTTFLGVCLGISSSKYESSDAAFDGDFVVTDHGDRKTVMLELNPDSVDVEGKDSIRFKVKEGVPSVEDSHE